MKIVKKGINRICIMLYFTIFGVFRRHKQWILSVFAIHYNAIHKLRGHVWMNRFWSRIIEDVAQLVKVFKYINENPVKAGLAKKSEDYKYGGMYFIIRKIFDLVSKPDFKYC